jgi:AcrR family transcriptional regulator
MVKQVRGSYSVGIARREAILDAATAYFAKGDYHRTPMKRIAADVGITEGGLLHHFPSKKHLLLAVAERRLDSTARWVLDLPEDAAGLDVLQRLVEATARHLTEPGLIELFVLVSAEAADASSPAHTLFAERYESAIDGLATLLRRAVDRGQFRSGLDCAALARECIAVSDGLQLQWVLSGGRTDLVGLVRAHVDRLARAVTVDGSGLDKASGT